MKRNIYKRFQQDEIKKAKKAMWVIECMRIGLGFNGLFLIFAMIHKLVIWLAASLGYTR